MMPATILIFLFGDLGDTIITVPAIRALRDRYPRARLLLLGKPLAADYVKRLGFVDDIIVVEKHEFDEPLASFRPRAVLALVTLLLRLRRERIDTVVIFHHLVTRWGALKYAVLALATGARRRVGIDNGRGWFLTDAVVDRGFGDRHEAEYWLDVARLLDAHGELRLEFSISQVENARAEELLLGVGERKHIVAIHPGTGWYGPGRRWGAHNFADTASKLVSQAEAVCILVGTEADRGEADHVSKRMKNEIVDLVGQTTVGVLAAVLARCTIVIANDGGVAHLAAAVGTPAVTIFGPSNDRAWRPLKGIVLEAGLPCRPCFYRDFERGLPAGCATRECLALVTPKMVVDAAISALQESSLA